MYWLTKFKKYNSVAAGILISAASFFSCSSPTVATHHDQLYIDLPTFFEQEIKHLTLLNPSVSKTVSKDGLSELSEVTIKDWNRELSSFTSIDLNKPTYSGQISKDSTDRHVTLTVDNPNLDISVVHIDYDEENLPRSITVVRKKNNLLYNTTETLSYQKDLKYKIEKTQDILVVGQNNYVIEGNILSKK